MAALRFVLSLVAALLAALAAGDLRALDEPGSAALGLLGYAVALLALGSAAGAAESLVRRRNPPADD